MTWCLVYFTDLTKRKMEILVIDNVRNVLQHGSLLTPVVESRDCEL